MLIKKKHENNKKKKNKLDMYKYLFNFKSIFNSKPSVFKWNKNSKAIKTIVPSSTHKKPVNNSICTKLIYKPNSIISVNKYNNT
jgi:hypothetical protein